MIHQFFFLPRTWELSFYKVFMFFMFYAHTSLEPEMARGLWFGSLVASSLSSFWGFVTARCMLFLYHLKSKGLCVDRHAYLLCDKLKVPMVVQIIFTMYICFDAGSAFSVLESARQNLSRSEQIENKHIRWRIAPGKEFSNNCKGNLHWFLPTLGLWWNYWQ